MSKDSQVSSDSQILSLLDQPVEKQFPQLQIQNQVNVTIEGKFEMNNGNIQVANHYNQFSQGSTDKGPLEIEDIFNQGAQCQTPEPIEQENIQEKKIKDNVRKNTRFAKLSIYLKGFLSKYRVKKDRISQWLDRKYQRDLKFYFCVLSLAQIEKLDKEIIEYLQCSLENYMNSSENALVDKLIIKELSNFIQVGKCFLYQDKKQALEKGIKKSSPRDNCRMKILELFPQIII